MASRAGQLFTSAEGRRSIPLAVASILSLSLAPAKKSSSLRAKESDCPPKSPFATAPSRSANFDGLLTDRYITGDAPPRRPTRSRQPPGHLIPKPSRLVTAPPVHTLLHKIRRPGSRPSKNATEIPAQPKYFSPIAFPCSAPSRSSPASKSTGSKTIPVQSFFATKNEVTKRTAAQKAPSQSKAQAS